GGTVDARSGVLTLNGGTSTGGTYNAAANSVLDLTAGSTQTLTGTYTGSGAGTVQFSGGTLSLGVAGGTFNFATGLFQWIGGTISGGTLNNTGTLGISGSGNKILNSATLRNTGTITWTGGGGVGLSTFAALVNAGTFLDQGDHVVFDNGGNNNSF